MSICRLCKQFFRDYDLLHSFPGRTEADLYLWIALHHERLAAAYNLAPLSPTAAVSSFAQVYGDTLIQRTVKGLLKGLHWVMGDDRPLGLTEEEFQDARARHEAGELTLGEVELLRAQLEAAEAHTGEVAANEGEPSADATDDPFASNGWYAPIGQRMEL